MAVAGTGVQLADGSTNVLPVGSTADQAGRVAAAPRPGAALPGARRTTRAGTCIPGTCRPGTSPTSPSTAKVSRGRPHGWPPTSTEPSTGHPGRAGHRPRPGPLPVSRLRLRCGGRSGAAPPPGIGRSAGRLARPRSDTELRRSPDREAPARHRTRTSDQRRSDGVDDQPTTPLTAACPPRASCSPTAPCSPRRTRSSPAARCGTSSPARCRSGTSTRLWVLARPLSGFAETFSQYIVEVGAGGGSDRPELDPRPRASSSSSSGGLGSDASTRTSTDWRPVATRTCPPGRPGRLHNRGDSAATFHWVRKAYEAVEGLDAPGGLRHQRDARSCRPRCPAPTAAG